MISTLVTLPTACFALLYGGLSRGVTGAGTALERQGRHKSEAGPLGCLRRDRRWVFVRVNFRGSAVW